MAKARGIRVKCQGSFSALGYFVPLDVQCRGMFSAVGCLMMWDV
jgi:hypothetical protein